MKMRERIKSMHITTRQKHILQIVYDFNEGWLDEETLEKRLGKLFLDKRHKPKGVSMKISDKEKEGLKEFNKDELIDYIEKLLTKIEKLKRRLENDRNKT